MDEDDIRMANNGGDESFLEMIPALAAALVGGVGLFKGFRGSALAKLRQLRKLKPKTEMEKELVSELEKALKYRQKSDKQIRDFRMQKKPQDERVFIDTEPKMYLTRTETYPAKPPLKVALESDRDVGELKDRLASKGVTLDRRNWDKYRASGGVDDDHYRNIRDYAKRLLKYPKDSLVPKIDNAVLRDQFLAERSGRLAEWPSYLWDPEDIPAYERLEAAIRRRTDPSFIEYSRNYD